MATFLEIAAHSVDNMFSLYFQLFVIFVISRFGFEGWSWVPIALVPDLCILCTFMSVEVPIFLFLMNMSSSHSLN